MAASNLTLRVATAVVMLPILFALLFLGQPWWWLAFLMLAAGVTGALELYGMSYPGDRVAQAVGVASVLAVIATIYLAPEHPKGIVATIVLVPTVAIVLSLSRLGDLQSAALQLMTGVFGPLWIGGGIGAVALLRKLGGPEGAGLSLLTLVLAWSGDTGGYFAGRAFGKHKLYEKVSPKKTVEGAIGGVLSVIAFTLATRALVVPSLSVRDAVVLAVVGGVLGILGDLGESLIKRSTGVKDSGGIVPGHGGMLDRIDAVLITAPVTLAYWLLFH
ncbi:MAG: phosphatidate cytidylyltransferase [Deltaproteobacteria bacterium]|nr:phosphatidate cytidylyltransferase [Deltaproteobacteria bacterium]